MRTRLLCLLLLPLMGATLVQAQDTPTSAFSVRYMVTYDGVGKQFTAWVVPDYNTPNAHNPDTDERGITAQFSLKVPLSFVLTEVRDVRGDWDKNAVKIDPHRHIPSRTGAGNAYYMIGKSPVETSYGEFKQGEPVALFTFKGNAADPAQVQALEVNDPFVGAANSEMSLNVRGSFYSRSGQDFQPHTRPVEQFVKATTLDVVLKDARRKELTSAPASAEEPTGTMLVYPNPVQQVLTVKYFSEKDQVPAVIEWIDLRGVVQQTKQATARQGLNTTQLNVAASPGGAYFLRTTIDGKSTTGKVHKQ